MDVSRPLTTALATSPTAMSAGESGVGTIASYVPSILTRLKIPKVVWLNAVFMAVVATVIGLAYAYAIDKIRGEGFAKSLVFLPTAISFVGAAVIWGLMYQQPKDYVVKDGDILFFKFNV